MSGHQKHIMDHLKELFEEFDKLPKNIKNSYKVRDAVSNLRESSGYDTYKSLVLAKDEERDADTIVIASDSHNVVDLVSHIQ